MHEHNNRQRPDETNEIANKSSSSSTPIHPSLTAEENADLISVLRYYSFARTRDDETLVEQFARQLAILRNQKPITEWDRRKVIPGQIVNAEVTKHLNAAHIILLFISPDYMASDECFHEMQQVVEKRALQNTIIIPILLRPVALLEETPFAHIQGFPRNGQPISELGNRKGAVFVEIANEISAIVKNFQVDGYAANQS